MAGFQWNINKRAWDAQMSSKFNCDLARICLLTELHSAEHNDNHYHDCKSPHSLIQVNILLWGDDSSSF